MRAPRTRNRRDTGGFTLIEAVISAVAATLLVGAGFLTMQTGQATYARGAIETALRSQATRMADRIARELAPCGASTLSVVPADDEGAGPYLVVQACTGFDGAAKTWSAPFLIGVEADAAATPVPDLGTAVDADAAGLPDTMDDAPPPSDSLDPLDDVSAASVVLIVGGQKTILGSNLAPDGFQVSVEGSVVSFRLDLERPIPGKPPVRAGATRAVRLAN